MKVLVVDDEYCYFYNGKYYLREYGHILINRYLMTYNDVRFVVRTKKVKSKDALGPFSNELKDPRIEILPMPFFQGPIQYAKKYFRVRKCANESVKGCNLAFLRLPSTIGFAIWKVLKNNHIPYATELVFDCWDGYITAENYVNKFLWKCLHQKQVYACNSAIGVACVTKYYLQSHYQSKIEGAVTSNYSSIELPANFYYHAREYPNKESLDVVHVANQVQFNSRKGHRELIDTIAILKAEGYNVIVTFIGEDYQDGVRLLSEYAKKNNVHKQIKFAGYLSYSQMRCVLETSDIAVLPTKAEGLPRALIEGMAMGLPCISTPVSGNLELLDKEFLVNYNDVNGFAKTIITLISDKSLYKKVSEINFERSKEFENTLLNIRRKQFFDQIKDIAINYQNGRI